MDFRSSILSKDFTEEENDLLDPVFKKFCDIGKEHSLFTRLSAENSRGESWCKIKFSI